jgi:rubrerythrin
MAFSFNSDEVFEIAEQIEINGSEFYSKAAVSVSDPAHRKLLEELAAVEMVHFDIFTEMRKSLSDSEKQSAVPDPYDEATLYLKALSDTKVFYKKTIDISSFEAILISAIEREKDSIVFYVGMKELVPARIGKERIDAIIDEEKKHITRLAAELLSLKK